MFGKSVKVKCVEAFIWIHIFLFEELLIKVLNMLKQYNIQDKVSRVTFTTNGFNLLKVIPYFKNVINYVNISMHHYNQEERNKIFKTNTPSNYDYKLMVDKLADIGIKTSSTCVTYKSIENFKKFMNIYISFCKEIGFVSVRFRDNVFWKDSQFDIYMNLALNDDQFEVIQCENTSDSKWCRLKMKDKFRVFFLHGVKDTSSVSKGIEYVIADDGKCYTDFYKKESIENYKLLIGKIYDIK